MKIFVTGGGGFIGSNFINSVQDAYDVICFGHGVNYPQLIKTFGKNVQLVEGEITDRNLVSEAMKGVDIVVHLAGPAGKDACSRNPAKATLSHALGTHVVLTEAIKTGVERFVFASTHAVYSTYKKRTIPFTEDMSLEPDELYGALKSMAEYEIMDSDSDYVILRFANVYGYGNGVFVSKAGGAIGNFIKSALSGSDITIYGNGEQGIDYLNISDVCSAMKTMIEKNSVNHEIFNVGSGKLIVIADLADKVANIAKEKFNRRISVKKLPAPEGSIWPDRLMSIGKINEKIGWQPKVSIDEGISEMLERGG